MTYNPYSFNLQNSAPVEVTSTTQQMNADTTYIASNSSRVIFTLPITISKGSQIRVRGRGDGGWRIMQNANQVITGGSSTTTGSSGYMESQTASDTIALECVADNTEFRIIAGQGTKTIV